MKTQLSIPPLIFRCFIIVMAICYMISPLKHTVFDMLHAASHYIEDRVNNYNKNTEIVTFSHSHDASGHHINTSSSHSHTNSHHHHSHSKAVTTNHSHQLLTFLNTVLSSSDEQKEHQKSIFKTDIDKHVLTSEFSFKGIIFNTTSKETWFTFLPYYNIHLSTLSPPPQFIS